jgi:hypothetical protein
MPHLQSAGGLADTLTIQGMLSLRRLESGAIAVVRD